MCFVASSREFAVGSEFWLEIIYGQAISSWPFFLYIEGVFFSGQIVSLVLCGCFCGFYFEYIKKRLNTRKGEGLAAMRGSIKGRGRSNAFTGQAVVFFCEGVASGRSAKKSPPSSMTP